MQPDCAVCPGSVEFAAESFESAGVDETMRDNTPERIPAEAICRVLIELIGQRQFDHWFRDKTRLEVAGQTLLVFTANPFLQKWLHKQHRTALLQAACAILGPSADLRFDVDPGLAEAAAVRNPESQASRALHNRPARPGNSPTTPAVPRGSIAPGDSAQIQLGRRFADLNDFVSGTCNQLALTAVQQICERPHGGAGPLFIYGPVGSGKTHLLEGVYRRIRQTDSSLNVVFLTSEQFTNHFTQAYRGHTLPAFRQRFRTVDVLLVDDIDFLDAKRVVQEEFLHTIQQLESHGKLLVACGDRHPRLLLKINDELKTRFLSGMVCRLEPADLETRERIAAGKARRLNADISPEAIKYVARRFAGSVRELEGALCCLQVYQRMTGRRVGTSAAREVLGDLERDCLRVVRMSDIERVVCDLFGVEAADLKSPRRTKSVSEPRMLAMYLARRHTRAAYSEIGAYFGGRNHATVIAADQKISASLERNVEIRIASQTWRLSDVVETLEQQLLAG